METRSRPKGAHFLFVVRKSRMFDDFWGREPGSQTENRAVWNREPGSRTEIRSKIDTKSSALHLQTTQQAERCAFPVRSPQITHF